MRYFDGITDINELTLRRQELIEEINTQFTEQKKLVRSKVEFKPMSVIQGSSIVKTQDLPVFGAFIPTAKDIESHSLVYTPEGVNF